MDTLCPKLLEGAAGEHWSCVADLWDEELSCWKAEVIYSIYEPDSASAILSIPWPSVSCLDKHCWVGNARGVFIVRHYALLTDANTPVASVDWEKLWKSKIHSRLKVFSWRLLSGVLPIKALLQDLLGSTDGLCMLCGEKREAILHHFMECPITRRIACATLWSCRLEAWTVESVDELFTLCFPMQPLKGILINKELHAMF